MAKIHGIAYIMIGVIISGLSYYIDQNIKKGFSLFIYVGLLMTIVGVIKLAAQYARSRKEKPAKARQAVHHHPTPGYAHQRALYCPRCGIALNPADNFCYNCGNRISHGR